MAENFHFKNHFQAIVNHLIEQGFFFPSSNLYGGLSHVWDYGPLGVIMKRNLSQLWWHHFVATQSNVVGLDTAILMKEQVWQASGHVKKFIDILAECANCHKRYRLDHLLDAKKLNYPEDQDDLLAWTKLIKTHHLSCEKCKIVLQEAKKFNLLFATKKGIVEEDQKKLYLRPETAQGIFVNFKNVVRTTRQRIPFGIAQIGKSFRNEITPSNFIFRVLEFEQMELEFFVKPNAEAKKVWFAYWQKKCITFLQQLGLKSSHVKLQEHSSDQLAHYADKTMDIEYKFPFGWSELWGISSRGSYDLVQHQNASKEDLSYLDPFSHQKYLPYIIEPSVGIERLLLAFLCDSYCSETVPATQATRVYLKLSPLLSPYVIAVLPLVKKQHVLAQKIFDTLLKEFRVVYDTTGSIGKRYRRQDAIGTNFCLTVDYDSIIDHTVTIRHRDTMEQVRIPSSDIKGYLKKFLINR